MFSMVNNTYTIYNVGKIDKTIIFTIHLGIKKYSTTNHYGEIVDGLLLFTNIILLLLYYNIYIYIYIYVIDQSNKSSQNSMVLHG